jgi:hypothetical protein
LHRCRSSCLLISARTLCAGPEFDVATAERAYAIAARESAAPGPVGAPLNGAPLNLAIEVRQVMAAPSA